MKDNTSAFDSTEYDNKVSCALPYYKEYNKQIYDLIRALKLDKFKWLDTGCGTGNLIFKIKDNYKDSEFVLCDPSENMLNAAKEKLKDINNITFRNISSQELDYKDCFDIVTSVQSHHYLSKEKRKEAVKNCFDALKKGGVYITFENIALSSKESEGIGIKRWRNFLTDNGKSPEEAEKHVARRGTEVFPITIKEHIALLYEAGFQAVDILWASYMQAGFFAIKGTEQNEKDCDKQLLLSNLHKLHTTELGVKRIRENLSLDTEDVIHRCKGQILSPNAAISKKGKNWYVNTDTCTLTINAQSYTVITAHKRT